MRTSKMILGVFAGIAAGALIGVLLAPDSGENTRKKIASRSQDMMDEMKTKFNSVVESFNEQKDQLLRDAKNKVSDMTGRVSNSVVDGVHKVQDKVTDTVRKVNV